jgi:branched-chain amino acid transport system permease protein
MGIIQVIVSGLIVGGLYAVVATGLSLTWGVMNIVNVSHGAFYMIGSFITYSLYMKLGVNPFLSFLLTLLVIFAVGLVAERTLIHPVRKSGENVVLITFALAIFLEEVARITWGLIYRTTAPYFKGTINIFGIILDWQRVGTFCIGILVLIVFNMFLKKTKIGKATRMVEQDEEVAMLLGINVDRIYLITFAIGACLAASAGSLLAPLYLIYPSMGWTPLLFSFSIVVLGGMGSMKGTIYAGFLFGVISLLTTYLISSGWVNVIPFTILVLVLLVKPSGLFGREA